MNGELRCGMKFCIVQNIFGAGTDTSSITVEWGLAELTNHPIMMEKARQEVDSVVGRSRLVLLELHLHYSLFHKCTLAALIQCFEWKVVLCMLHQKQTQGKNTNKFLKTECVHEVIVKMGFGINQKMNSNSGTGMDIFAAGTDTSAVTMEWALAELINNPNILERAREEIDSVVGKSRLGQESDIANLPYVQAILTLRLHPTGPVILRESSESCTINGYEIPARTRLFVNRDPNYWENPPELQPERFLCAGENGRSQLDVRGLNILLKRTTIK
ncbi:hypothetical protein POTOM_051445 [Populus tomentosa]|uniref:Uncharacterized protein n=1 Tax=Populus tomentosa TaxID=118781 RepID=A0A8X7YGD6_POPTO|nr:hypothetical protein POTOM_051445 [Populus tomentosa]